jgi:tetratricopeptide (TPR) repeat protein
MAAKKTRKEILLPEIKETNRFTFTDFWVQALLLALLGFGIYCNTFKNEYALDDGIVIQKNNYVQQGIRGIPKILSTDEFDSFYKQMGAKQQLSGGRYRPLSVVTFAIEQQLFGPKEKKSKDLETEKLSTEVSTVRHVVNVLLYVLSVVVLLYFLRNFIFKENHLVAFITCLIFLIHPIHTEVIANVKSRDEIMSFLFIILTFIFVFRYRETKKLNQLFWGLLFYFFALLSKEYAITLILLIPMLLYIVNGDSLKESAMSVIPFSIVAVIYVLIRYRVVGLGSSVENPDVLNNPFLFASKPEKWATKIEILNHYLKLLFYPQPLSSDYSYSTIPYTNFGNGWVWMSILIHLSMLIGMIVLFLKRNILSFALAFYLFHLFLVSNLMMDIGATMGERLVFHSSFGLAIILAVAANWCLERMSNVSVKKIIGTAFFSLITIWCSVNIVARNQQWKNDITLFIADAETVPNSALVNGNAGKAYIDLSEKPENKLQENELIQKAIVHFEKSVSIHKQYVNGYLNLGVAYYKLKQYDKAKANWDIAKSIYPNHPLLKSHYKLLASIYYNQGMQLGPKQPEGAIKLLQKAVALDPENAEYWYNIGGASYTMKDFDGARTAWTNALALNPKDTLAMRGMAALPKKN